MKAKFFCKNCGSIFDLDAQDHGDGFLHPLNQECPNCGYEGELVQADKYVDMSLVSVKTDRAKSPAPTAIPNNKLLCTSSLASLVALRTSIASIYELQSKADNISYEIKKRNDKIDSLLRKNNEINSLLRSNNNINNNELNSGNDYSEIGSKEDIARVRDRLLNENSDKYYAQDLAKAKRIKLISVLLAVLICVGLAISLAVIEFTLLFNPTKIHLFFDSALNSTWVYALILGPIFVAVVIVAARIKTNYLLIDIQNKRKRKYLKKQIDKDLQADLTARRNAAHATIQSNNNQIAAYRAANGLDMQDIMRLRMEIRREADYLDGVYRSLIHRSDWENLDYIIYVFVTGRADNLKEALHLVDEQRRAEMIVKAIGMAADYLASNISSSISSLRSELSNSLRQLSADLSGMRRSLQLQNKEYSQGISKIVNLDSKICDYSRQSYDMMKRINNSLKS